jgi:hypothetical protein
MAKKGTTAAKPANPDVSTPPARGRPSALLDTRVVYCGDCLEQIRNLPDACVDLVYIDPPFNSNRNDEVFWGETKEKRAFEDCHASTQAYIDYMRPRCVELAGRWTSVRTAVCGGVAGLGIRFHNRLRDDLKSRDDELKV